MSAVMTGSPEFGSIPPGAYAPCPATGSGPVAPGLMGIVKPRCEELLCLP